MRKSLLTLFVVCAFGLFTAMAQDSSSASSQSGSQQPTYSQSTTTTNTQSSSTTNNSSDQSSMSTVPQNQGAMSNGATQTSNGGEQTVEGCLMHEQTSYYIQPENGGTRVQLSPSRSLDSYIGQHVRVTGHNGSASGDNSSAVSSGGPSDLSGGTLTVTGVKTISATCSPASGSSQQ